MATITAAFTLHLTPNTAVPARFVRRVDQGGITVEQTTLSGPCQYCGRDNQHTWVLFDSDGPAACDVTA